MRLAVLKERGVSEFRVAATPDTVKKLVGLGLTVAIEAGAGLTSAISDADYAAAGAEIAPDAHAALMGANIVFAVQMPGPDIRRMFLRPCLLVCVASAFADPSLVTDLAQAGIDCAAMELLPRITRAQSMDVLSSQANLAGYRAVIEAATAFQRGFPMMMTAAGTVPWSSAPAWPACRPSPPPAAWAASSPPPTSAPPRRRRSNPWAPPISASRTRRPPARPAPTPAK
jgi:NAD(P) transhydrogenase subunit alpha